LHGVLLQIAVHLAANSPKCGTNGVLFQYIFISLHSQATPLLHQNKPSRESIFCGKMGGWWIKMALIVLKFSLKSRQNQRVVNTREWATARKAHTLTTTRADGCRACSSWPTGTKLWKRRSRTPSTVGFRLVEKAVKDLRQINF